MKDSPVILLKSKESTEYEIQNRLFAKLKNYRLSVAGLFQKMILEHSTDKAHLSHNIVKNVINNLVYEVNRIQVNEKLFMNHSLLAFKIHFKNVLLHFNEIFDDKLSVVIILDQPVMEFACLTFTKGFVFYKFIVSFFYSDRVNLESFSN